jgi:hypothetical protein
MFLDDCTGTFISARVVTIFFHAPHHLHIRW